jgi:AcrR family transcriptional regulator
MVADTTKERILDAAEELFAIQGHSAVAFREIAEQSNLHISQIVYHFGNKLNLLEAIVVRRADMLNSDRIERLKAYHGLYGYNHQDPEPIIRALVEPYLSRIASGDVHWRYFGAITGHIVWDPATRAIMERAYNSVAIQYINAMCSAWPDVPQEAIHRGFQFILALIFSVGADDGRLESLSNGRFSLREYERSGIHVIPFIVSGFRGLIRTDTSLPSLHAAPMEEVALVRRPS